MLRLLHLVGLVLTAGTSVAVARWVHRQTDDRAGTVMIVLLAVHAAMATLVAAQLVVEPVAWKEALATAWLALIVCNSQTWLVFAVYYTGREYWLSRPVWAVVVAYAVVPTAVFFTDPLHGVIGVEYVLLDEPFRHLSPRNTPGLQALFAVSLLPVIVGFGIALRMHLFSRRTSRGQTAALLVGIAAVYVPGIAATTPYVPVRGFPYGVLGAGVFGVVVGVALFRDRMFGVAPLARDRLFGALDDGVLVVDAKQRIVDYNDGMRSLLPDIDDHTAEQVDTSYPQLLESAADRERADADPAVPSTAAYRATESEEPFAATVRLPPGDPDRTLRVRASAIRSGGEPRGYALVFRDISELESYAADLERKTRKLERFASALSHDLRNPVSVASGSLELELETRDSERVRRALTALDRIDQTIDDLLTLSREGETIEDPSPVALGEVVADAWATSDTGGAALNIELDGDRILADRSRLQTLLENLFRNSVEHGSTGPASEATQRGEGVTVTVGSLTGGFYVEDDGPGIPEGERERVFEYGHSGADGTGIGLAIVGSVADAHGWTIAVAGGDDGGARFEIRGVEGTETAPTP